ncbi:MAG TPA: DUF4199 domain-containing protein [Ignavibacteriaceae bacterium]|jgi:uncharacterized membrane protein YfcA|nr:DUF4199 domain-containing protein [Ignavibacteriaceae bacterium]
MSNKIYLPPLVAGFGAAVLTTIPGVREFGCCLIVPLAVFTALLLYRKTLNHDTNLTVKTSLLIGFLTGLFAALFSTFFDVLITLFTHSNDFVATLPQTEQLLNSFNLGEAAKQTIDLMEGMANQITSTGFSLLYTIFILVSNLIVDSIFGLLGGIIGRMIVNRKSPTA